MQRPSQRLWLVLALCIRPLADVVRQYEVVRPWQDIPLAAGLLERFAERRRDEDWLASAQLGARHIVLNTQAECLVSSVGGTLSLVDVVGELALSQERAGVRRFLGVHAGRAHFAITLPPAAEVGPGEHSNVEHSNGEHSNGEHSTGEHSNGEQPSGEQPSGEQVATVTALAGTDRQWVGLRQLASALTPVDAEVVTTAVALQNWHIRHRFCPNCGSPTIEAEAGWLRTCSADGTSHFPRTDPAVIMLVHDGDGRALLGRSPAWGSGRFSTLAGFVEPGESLEAAVAREVFEEAGVQILEARYVASQPWPFPASIMLGFTALADSRAPIVVDRAELAEAGWFTREEIAQARRATDESSISENWALEGSSSLLADSVVRQISPKLSISRYLIDRWLDADE